MLQLLPKRWHGYIYIFADVVTLVFAIVAIYWSLHTISTVIEFGAAAPALRISKAWFECAVPLGFTLMIWRLVQSIRRDIRTSAPGATRSRARCCSTDATIPMTHCVHQGRADRLRLAPDMSRSFQC